MAMIDLKYLNNKKISILGFGREGKSTYRLLRSVYPTIPLTILDENENIKSDSLILDDKNLDILSYKGCMMSVDDFDYAIKSPGIPSHSLPVELNRVKITSQADIFLKNFGWQTIGVTGTKGKSTTSSLIYHIIKNSGRPVLLVGNIGVPPFDCVQDITDQTIVVMEMSSHQLEYVENSPHIAILLNIFQEHLDHYYSYHDYQAAKFNIGKFQTPNDFFLYNIDNETINIFLTNQTSNCSGTAISFTIENNKEATLFRNNNTVVLKLIEDTLILYDFSSGQQLLGEHNHYNIMVSVAACKLMGIGLNDIQSGVGSFKGLDHRIELVGIFNGIIWYNDSIATIPEATIEAVKALKSVDTLILGGFDRGIDYSLLYPFIKSSHITNIILIGDAGKRILNESGTFVGANKQVYSAANYSEVIDIASKVTQKGKICLLSPAAASYDMFKNFEERGDFFKKKVRMLKSPR